MIEEGKLLTGSLTAFNGFRFGENPYTYPEAKRVLRLAMDELRKREDLREALRVDPDRRGRPAITGSKGGVWDFLLFNSHPEGKSHNARPHLNLNISADGGVGAPAILPDKAGTAWGKLKTLGEAGFLDVAEEVLKEMRSPLLSKCPGAKPHPGICQRHPKGSISPLITDAESRLDLRARRGDRQARRARPRGRLARLQAVYPEAGGVKPGAAGGGIFDARRERHAFGIIGANGAITAFLVSRQRVTPRNTAPSRPRPRSARTGGSPRGSRSRTGARARPPASPGSPSAGNGRRLPPGRPR